MIKYHDNNGNKRFEVTPGTHEYADNWDPNAKYGENEYVSVHFRIECPAFRGQYGNFANNEDNDAFTEEKLKAFQSIGWEEEKPEFNGRCMTVVKGKASLYLHPQDFSGIVLKREVKQIAEALENNATFTIRWVDIYETVYDITDEEYAEYMAKKTKETWTLLFENCKTPRRNKYFYRYNIAEGIAKRIQLPRIGCRSVYDVNKGALEFVQKCIDDMIEQQYLFAAQNKNGYDCIRTPNKGELKQMGKKAIA